MRRDIDIAVATNRIKLDVETKRILDFCFFFLEDNLSLPADLSEEDLGFYRRCLEKLISRDQMPPYVMDVLEVNSCVAQSIEIQVAVYGAAKSLKTGRIVHIMGLRDFVLKAVSMSFSLSDASEHSPEDYP